MKDNQESTRVFPLCKALHKGKTTLSKYYLKGDWSSGEYLNWDVDETKQAILKKQWLKSSPIVIFDEIHKYPKWKSWIKGVWDSRPDEQTYLVTGSARLDVYKKGGDSLMGRYHYWRLHPLSLDELPEGMNVETAYTRLLTLGGFRNRFSLETNGKQDGGARNAFHALLKKIFATLNI